MHAATGTAAAAAAGPSKVDRLLAAEDPVDVLDRGVSFDFLSKLLKKQKLGGGMTTREVVLRYVLPQTSNSRCSLSGLLRVLHPQSVGRATHYIIHAWDGEFERLVRALEVIDAAWEEEDGDGSSRPYFWLDVFALNQRGQASRAVLGEEAKWIQRDNLFAGVKSSLRRVPQVCCMCDPVSAPLVLARKWCLYECALALALREQQQPQSQEDEADTEVVEPPPGVLLCAVPEPPDCDPFAPLLDGSQLDATSWYAVDYDKASTSFPVDMEWLSSEALSMSPLGAQFVNEQVQHLFLAWVSARLASRVLAEDFLDSTSVEQRLVAMHQLSNVIVRSDVSSGAHTAREILLRCMARATELWGQDTGDDRLLSMQHDYACLIGRFFKELKPAEMLLRQVLALRTDEQGVIDTSEALGLVLKERRKLTEAIALFRDVCHRKQQQQQQNNNAADTLRSFNHLALTLQKKELYSEAEQVFKRVITEGTDALGRHSLDVMIWSNNLSMLYQDTQQLDKAELLLRMTLRNAETGLGPMHPHTLVLVFNLGYVLWHQGRHRIAEQMFRRELAACEASKGPLHKDTIKSRRNLDRFLVEKQQLQPAIVVVEQPVGRSRSGDTQQDDEDDEDDDEDDEEDDGGAVEEYEA